MDQFRFDRGFDGRFSLPTNKKMELARCDRWTGKELPSEKIK